MSMGVKIVSKNKKAFHEYNISDRMEAGVELMGTEVKSIRAGKVNLSDGWVDFSGGEAILKEIHISPYSHGNYNNHTEKRARRLLLKRREIDRLERAVSEKGFSVVPISIYLKGQLVKIEIALAKGKKLHDKRESSKKKTADREMERALKR